MIEGKIEGKRGIGSKRKSWLSNLKEWTIESGATLICTTYDREICHYSCQHQQRWYLGGGSIGSHIHHHQFSTTTIQKNPFGKHSLISI